MARGDEGRLKRALHPMPPFVRAALEERSLLEIYRSRPAYQRNDYLGWIARAKLEPTRKKRLAQMLDELARGDVYMKMRWAPRPGAALPRRLRKSESRNPHFPSANRGGKKPE